MNPTVNLNRKLCLQEMMHNIVKEEDYFEDKDKRSQ